jgi:hypothetical protein
MKTRSAALAALLLASTCGHSSGDASQSTSNASAAAAGALEGVKYRVPMYPGTLTVPASTAHAGAYTFETSDDVQTVVAWYKLHVPANVGGSWEGSDGNNPVGIQEWNLVRAKPAQGEFYVDIEGVSKAAPGSDPGSKTIVEVGDN